MTQASGVYQSAKIHFSTSPLFVILFCAFLFASQGVEAQAPPGYTYCAPEGGTFTLPAKSHVAYGADNKFKYLFNQTGTITFNNETFGGDPIFGTYKSGYYKLANGQESTQNLITAFEKIKNHITGAAPLSALTINSIAQTIQQNIFVIGDSTDVVLAAFNLVDCYETIKGAIFMNASTQNGFSNDFGAVDGKEMVRAVFQVQQGILDYIYTPENIQKYQGILIGRKYKTADYFPGVCPAPSDPLAVYTAKVNATMPTEYGKRTAFSSTPARRPTGYYLAPGSLGTVKVPAALVNKGFKILVGAHTFERTGNDPVRRFFRVTNTFPITDTVTKIINPFGGGIYIITPYQAAEGIQEIQLSNVVPAPFFSAKSFDKTTLQNWLTVQRSNPAPWADFESDKYMMQVPRSWIYNYADPVTLMQDWDNRLDVVSKMLGYPAVRNNTILYLQIDVDIMFGGYGIGNPQINNTYNPNQVENGNKNHWFLKPGVDFWETEFHEMGHAQLFSNFPGEGEAAVNLLAAAIYNRLYGMNIDQALGESFNNQPQITRDQAALNWMVTPNFRAGKPMDISNTTKDEVRYQQRGYAKYVEMAALFGWEVIDSFYNREQLDYIAQTPSDGLKDVDSRILRFSRAAGVDMRPLVHFWGVQPKDSMLLRQRINAENLKPSKLICDRLTHYKAIIPLNNAQFVAHANAFFGGSVPAGGDPDYGSGWYNIWLPQYNATHGALAQSAMQQIIDIYFPGGCPTEEAIPTITVNSPSICPGQSATLTASGATTYLWSNGQTGSSITVNPSETTTYTVVGRAAGYYSIATAAQVTVNPIPVVSVENATICAGSMATLSAIGAADFVWSNGETSSSINVSPSETSNYSVIGSSLGCASLPVSAEVTVNPIPVISVENATICAGSIATLNASGAADFVWSNGETSSSINVSPSETSNYSVIGSSLGCASLPVSAEVTVNPIPVISVENATICAGSIATLNASGAMDFAWSNGETSSSINVSPSETSNYSVIGSSLGCSSLPASAEVTVNPIPVISVENATICAGSIATLSAIGAADFVWSNGETSSSINVSPSETSNYSVVGGSLGCSSLPVSAEVTVNPIPVISVENATICAGSIATLNAIGATDFVWSNGETSSSINVSPSETSNYSVFGNSLGCASLPVSAQVTVNPIPVISVENATICAGSIATLNASGAADFVWSNGGTSSSISVSPSETSTYSVIGSSLGCASLPVTAKVTVIPIPNVSGTSASICLGDSVTLTANGADQYTWNTGETGNSIVVSPTETSTYWVVGRKDGCTADPLPMEVTVNLRPTLDLGPDMILQQGQEAILDATTGLGQFYQWTTGANTPSITANAMGTYAVTVTSINGCSASDSVQVSIITGSNSPDNSYQITVAPNPTQDLIYITCTGSSIYTMQIINNLGILVAENRNIAADGSTQTISLANFPAGLYHVRVVSKGFAKSIPIVKI
jgi:hypothetical protein